MTIFALPFSLEDPLSILPSPYLEGFSHLKFPSFPVAGIHTGQNQNCLVQVPSFRRNMRLTSSVADSDDLPKDKRRSQSFYSASAAAVTWSPAEVRAVLLGVVLWDSSTPSTNHRFKALQYFMCGRISDSVETPTYLLSCEACTEGKGYFFQLIFRPQLGKSLSKDFSTSSRKES